MLLVDDRHPQPTKVDTLLDEGVGSHDDVDLAVGDPTEDLVPAGADGEVGIDLRPGQQRHPHNRSTGRGKQAVHPQRRSGPFLEWPQTRIREQRPDSEEVLSRQHLRGSHDRPLPPSLDTVEQRRHRHHRLARPDLSLQEAVHGDLLRQVGPDLVEDALLGGGERIRKPGDKTGGELPVDVVDHTPFLVPTSPLLHRQGDLQPEQLVEYQPAAGGGHLGDRLREVDVVEGGVPVDETVPADDARRHRVVDGSGSSHGVVDGPTHPAGAHLSDRWVNGHDASRRQGLFGPGEDVDIR